MTYLDILESRALTEEFKTSEDIVDKRLHTALRELAQLLDGLDRLGIERQPSSPQAL